MAKQYYDVRRETVLAAHCIPHVSGFAVAALLLATLCGAALLPGAYAVDVSIETTRDTYYYGDRLAYTVTVSEVTEGIAVLYIVDAGGKSSSPILLPISQQVTEERAPFPFEAITYPDGVWRLELHYADTVAGTEFLLADSGRVVIPAWIKDVGRLWALGAISGLQYLSAVENLIDQDIIEVGAVPAQSSNPHIPAWMRVTTAWWVDGLVSDQEYADALEYLIDRRVIRIVAEE